MTGTRLRIFSAAIAIIVVLGVFHFWGVAGLSIASAFAIVMVTHEFSRMVYKDSSRYAFLFELIAAANCASVFVITSYSTIFFALTSLLMFAIVLTKVRHGKTVHEVLTLQSQTALGLVYCGVLPGFILKILTLDNGISWFCAFLTMVFAGDVGAYFGGKFFGTRKLLEPVSPKKTVEGAVAGLLASTLAGVIFALWAGKQPFLLAGLALLTGLTAQIGDLFESVIKRASDVKDSGGILPGHGGMMDRLDGVYFSGPLFYFAASNYSYLIERWL